MQSRTFSASHFNEKNAQSRGLTGRAKIAFSGGGVRQACILRRMESERKLKSVCFRYKAFEQTLKKTSELYTVGSTDSMRHDGLAEAVAHRRHLARVAEPVLVDWRMEHPRVSSKHVVQLAVQMPRELYTERERAL